MLIIDQVYQGIGKAKLCVGVSTFCSDSGTVDQCVIGTEDERHGIQQE
jgi:hypothetical protein